MENLGILHLHGSARGWSENEQGDPSGCAKPPIDMKTKVQLKYMGLILKRNFCLHNPNLLHNLNGHPVPR